MGELRVRSGKGGTVRAVPLNVEVRRALWTWAATLTELEATVPPQQRARWTAAHGGCPGESWSIHRRAEPVEEYIGSTI